MARALNTFPESFADIMSGVRYSHTAPLAFSLPFGQVLRIREVSHPSRIPTGRTLFLRPLRVRLLTDEDGLQYARLVCWAPSTVQVLHI